jgi:ABC-type transport system involved in multi-copper enzyme maturation permease subunit
MFWNTLSVENTKNLKRRMLWIELGILAVLIIVLYTIIYATLQTSSVTGMDNEARQEVSSIITWPGALLNSLSFGSGSSLGGLLVMVLIGAATAQEYTWRTMHLWLSRGIPRPVLMGAKFVAMLVPIFLFVVTPLLIGGGLTAIFTLHIDKSLPLSQINWWHLTMSVLRTAYTLLPYAAMTFMLAIVTRSTAAAIGIGVAYTLLVEGVAATVFTLLGGVLRDIVVYLPGSLADGLLKLNSTAMAGQTVFSGDGTGMIKYLDPVPSAIGLGLWTLLFLVVAVWSFCRQDMSD